MFTDIYGFDSWSLEKDPEQMFILLETIFRAFDRIANRAQVFKVETIGDCYVAATGIPNPIKDHAPRMLRFARAVIRRMNELARELEVTLGPDTGDLSLRVGVHSGPGL